MGRLILHTPHLALSSIKLRIKFAHISATNLFFSLLLQYDWCSSIKGLSCPIEPGNITFSVKQNIEGGVPAWTYVLSMDIFNQTGDEISCLQLETKVAKKPKKKELKATLVDVAENEEFE